MPKSRKTITSKAAAQPARKAVRKSAPRRETRRAKTAAVTPANVAAGSMTAAVRPSKKSAIVALLERPDGAAIGDLAAATGWQQHSVRAALTGLRKEGKELVRSKDAGGITHYRLTAA
jgi:hypothetical protein